MQITFLNKISFTDNPEQFFQNINLSILSGEYLYDYNSFNITINELENSNTSAELLNIIAPSIEVTNEDSKKHKLIFEKTLNIYNKLAIITNDNLTYLVKKTDEGFHNYGRKLSIDYDIERYYSHVTDSNYESIDNINLKFLIFLLNIKISELDEYLDSSYKCSLEIEKVLDYLNGLDSLYDSWSISISKILKYKAEFLIYKINARNYKDFKIPENENPFKEFYTKLNSHYSTINNLNNGFEIDNIIEEIKIDKIQVIHNLNKYLKKICSREFTKKQIIINRLLSKIDTHKKEVETDFDLFSCISAKNLIKNTELFLKLKKEENENYPNLCGEDFYKKASFDLNKFKSEILNNLNDRDFDDYKGYEEVLNFLNDFLDDFEDIEKVFPNIFNEDLDENTSKSYLSNLRNNFSILVNFYEDLLNKLEQTKNKHTNFDLKPIYLKLDECLIDSKILINNDGETDDINIKLFLDSSYILPVNYLKIDQDFLVIKNSFRFRINQVKEKIEVLINYNLSKKSKEAFENKVKENEFKLVSIIAMFVSIATFVLINVKIFDNKTGIESLGILLSLAGIFILFNSFFKWLIDDQLKKISNPLKSFLLWLPVFLIILGALLIYFNEGISLTKKIEDNFLKKADTILGTKIKEFEIIKFKDSLNRVEKNKEIIERIEKLESNKK